MKKKRKKERKESEGVVLISTVQGSGSGATAAAAADGDEDDRDDPEHPCPLRMRFKQGFFTHYSYIGVKELGPCTICSACGGMSSLSCLLPLTEADGLHDESPN